MPFQATLCVLKDWSFRNRPSGEKSVLAPMEIFAQVKGAYGLREYRGYGCTDPAVKPFCKNTCWLFPRFPMTSEALRANPPVLMNEREVALFVGICPRSVRMHFEKIIARDSSRNEATVSARCGACCAENARRIEGNKSEIRPEKCPATKYTGFNLRPVRERW